MKPASFTDHAPTSADEAVALLAKWGPRNGCILAGGHHGILHGATGASDRHQWDCRAGEDGSPRYRQKVDSVLRIGAWARHAVFDTGALPGAAGALPRKIVRHIAHYPIRMHGTFCGRPGLDEEELVDILSSNLCRCTGYAKIIKAVRAGAADMKARL